MIKRLLTDPSFLLLLAINLYCIYYYDQNPTEFKTLVWLYWFQSVLIGLFNFIDLLTIKRVDYGAWSAGGSGPENSKGCTAFFFLFHYQAFHLAYALFIGVQLHGTGKVDFRFLLMGIIAFTLGSLVHLIQNKIKQRTIPVNISKLFFTPYLRIVPMHLMILGPAFLGWQASTIFLVLKTIADLIMHVLTMHSSKYINQTSSPQ